MKKIVLLIALFATLILSGCGTTNPSVPAGEVGYVTNEPVVFGEKGEFLDIIIGPSSYGFGWANEIKYNVDYRPVTMVESFTFNPKLGTDSRILSLDQINIDANVAVVIGFKYAPGQDDENIEKFKLSMKSYFENYQDAWFRRFSKPFRQYVRESIGSESYGSAKQKRAQLGKMFFDHIKSELKDTPLRVFKVSVGSINPPERILQAEERKAAAIVERQQQEEELKLEDAKKAVMKKRAENIKETLKESPEYFRAIELEIKRTYAESFRNLSTGEQAKTLNKVLFIPYGTPVTASTPR